MAIKSAQVSVGTAPVELSGSDATPVNGSTILVSPVADIFVGGSDVSTANGFKVPAGSTFSYDFTSESERLFAVAAATTNVYVLKGSV